MSAEIVCHESRELWGPSLGKAAWFRDGDGVARKGFARTVPGQLWERTAERTAS